QHIEVTVLVKYAGIHQLKFRIGLGAPAILFHQLSVGKLRLRILVEIPHVRVGWSVIEIEVAFFYVFAVVAFFAAQSKEPFLEDRIAAVPQSRSKAETLMAVADARQAVFIPAVDARTGVIVREIIPGLAGGAVVLTHRSPGALGHVRAPALPVHLPQARLL